jgi:hypothetical protein
VAIPLARHVTQKQAENKLHYRSACLEINKRMIVPAIIGGTGMVTKGLKKNLEAMPGKHSIDSPQKTTVLGTSLIIWKVLQSET